MFQCHYGGMETAFRLHACLAWVLFQCHYGGMETFVGGVRYSDLSGVSMPLRGDGDYFTDLANAMEL